MNWKSIQSRLGVFRRKVISAHQLFKGLIIKHPILVIPAFLGYVVGTIFVGSFTAFLCLAIPADTGFFRDSPLNTAIFLTLFVVIFAAETLLLWSHFVFLSYAAFSAVLRKQTTFRKVSRIVQLVVAVLFAFSVLHYYVALFSNPPAYSGMSLPIPDHGWTEPSLWLDQILERLIFIPKVTTLIDCLYFSAVTMATVGYGDIHPVSIAAKLLTIVQLIISFALIVIVLGGMLSQDQARDD